MGHAGRPDLAAMAKGVSSQLVRVSQLPMLPADARAAAGEAALLLVELTARLTALEGHVASLHAAVIEGKV